MNIILLHDTDENMNLGIAGVNQIFICDNRLYYFSENGNKGSVSLKHAKTIEILEEENND